MIPRDGALAALGRFLNRHAQENEIRNMTIDILMKMARPCIKYQLFCL